MNNVLEITKDFSFNSISLANPTQLTGGTHFTKASLGSYSKNIYLQLPRCLTKQGIVKNNSKMYCDLMFNNNEKDIIEWFENFEAICQKKIYDNRELWFHNNVDMNDVEEMMNPIMRSFKSGKNILIRTHIKNSKCVAYDENQKLVNLEELKAEDYIIPLINIDGIKFTSKDFKIEIYLTQIMVLIPQDEFERNCLIKIENKVDKSKNLEQSKTKKSDNDDTNAYNNKVDNNEVDNNNDENTSNEIVLYPTNVENVENVENDSDTLEKVSHPKNSCNLEEINLDILDISELSDIVDLKKPNEVYYEIYKSAKKKANDLRNNAIEAYLEAKNIKLKYGLEQLDDSDEDFNNMEKNI
jgi:hypothetical protein